MSVASSPESEHTHRLRDWVAGTLVVILFGLACAAAAFGAVSATSPFLAAAAGQVSELQLPLRAFGAVLFACFYLAKLALMACAAVTIRRIHRLSFRRVLLGFPVVALSLALIAAWPEIPAGLPEAAQRAYSNAGVTTTGIVLFVAGVAFVYARARRAPR